MCTSQLLFFYLPTYAQTIVLCEFHLLYYKLSLLQLSKVTCVVCVLLLTAILNLSIIKFARLIIYD